MAWAAFGVALFAVLLNFGQYMLGRREDKRRDEEIRLLNKGSGICARARYGDRQVHEGFPDGGHRGSV